MTKKKNPDEIPSQGSARKLSPSYRIEIPSGEWTVGSIAWNAEGGMIILDPRLANLVEEKVREDKELSLGIPPPDGEGSTAALIIEPQPVKGPIPLTLCPCDVLRLKLLKVNEPTGDPMLGSIHT